MVVVVTFQYNMLYQPLINHNIELGARAVLDWDCGEGAILIPDADSKIFVHWLTDKGNIKSTYTMTYDTKLVGKVRLTNGLDKKTNIHVVKIS